MSSLLVHRLVKGLFGLPTVLVRANLSKVETVLLRRLCVLVFIEHDSRRLRRAPGVPDPLQRAPAASVPEPTPPDIETQPTRHVTDLDELRSIRREAVATCTINEYHHTAQAT
ncbi:hypothetical protein [Nonomuraea wenchangensis]|uniref:hypothetical protein n=1 Tax=Nonomuraea wenchangensis TaxID=568860 RepID=UPI001160593F|nr:hypothetical protein [Nonomuraea wenchangensis]